MLLQKEKPSRGWQPWPGPNLRKRACQHHFNSNSNETGHKQGPATAELSPPDAHRRQLSARVGAVLRSAPAFRVHPVRPHTSGH